jgi:hypothetical protein
MSNRVLDPKKLPPDEEMMWRTAEASTEVPSFYVKELLMRLRGETPTPLGGKCTNSVTGHIRSPMDSRVCVWCQQILPPEPLKAGELVRVLRGEWKDCIGVTQQAELSGYVTVVIEMHVSLPVDTLTRGLAK